MLTSLTVLDCFLQTSFDSFNGNVRNLFPFQVCIHILDGFALPSQFQLRP
jgi:hypothetical protein